MFFSAFLLLLSTASLEATLPDINSFMPNIFAMVPMNGLNGQVSVNDQVFTFGDRQPASAPISTTITTQSQPIVSQEVRQVVRQPSPANMITIPNNFAQSTPQVINQGIPAPQSGRQNIQIVEMRPQEIPTFVLNSGSNPSNNRPTLENAPTFESRFPSFDSRVPNFESQNPRFDSSSLPNIRSTEVGSTFANNANSNFADEFSQPSPASSLPFGGLPFNNQFNSQPFPMNSQSNGSPREDPLVVMPLVVSPDRLLRHNGTTTPLPMPALFVAASDRNERVQPLESTPVEVTGSDRSIPLAFPHDSVKVSRETTSFILPVPTITQIESSHPDPNMQSLLEKHLPPVLSHDTSVHTINATDFGSTQHFPNFVHLFRPQNIPSLAELDAKTQWQQSSQVETTTSSANSTQSINLS
jgi:hypothetical protein